MRAVTDLRSFDVVVVAFNDDATLGRCLGTVARLDPGPARVIVVDNASTDDSVAVARHGGAEVLEVGENTGFAGGMNRGIAASTAPWVLCLNPDCAVESDFVGSMLDALGHRPEADTTAAVTGLLIRAEGTDLRPTDTVDAAGMVVTPSGRHFDRAAGQPVADAPADLAWVFGGTGAATLYRRQALDDVAYPDGQVFPESFFCYREDAELAWRLQHRGWGCLYVPEARAHHRRGFQPEGGRRDHRWINRHSVKNRFLLRAHCADRSWLWRCFPDWLLRDVLVVGACLTVEWSSLPALAEAWRWRRDALARRRWVMDRRTAPPRRVRRWFRRPRGWVETVVP